MLVQVHTNLPQLEESTGFRKLQPISPAIFWFITYIFDMIIHIITSLCIEIYYTLFDVHSFGIVEYSKFKKKKLKLLFKVKYARVFSMDLDPFGTVWLGLFTTVVHTLSSLFEPNSYVLHLFFFCFSKRFERVHCRVKSKHIVQSMYFSASMADITCANTKSMDKF